MKRCAVAIVALCLMTGVAGVAFQIEAPTTNMLVGQQVPFAVAGAKGSVRWATTAPAIALVSSMGVVKGIAPGLATITARSGNLSASQGVVIRNRNDTDNPPDPPADATVFYVDPDWAGSHTGAAVTPWSALSNTGAWTAIDAALATGTVTVYFSARAAGSDTNQATVTALNVLRTDTSTHRLTLNGMSFYNSNDSTPSWSAYAGLSRLTITSNYPISTGDAGRSNVTIKGFSLIAPQGQIIYWWGGDNVIIEDNECQSTVTNTVGPGIYFGYTEHETITNCPTPNISLTESCTVYTNLIIRRNNVHDTEGEGIYVGGCGDQTDCLSHDGVLIEGNTVGPNIGIYGGEQDAIDLKDGLRNVIVRGNTIVLQTESRDGITTESAALIERNYIENAGHFGINFSAYWNNAGPGSRTAPVARNNIVVHTGNNTVSGFTYRIGIGVEFNGDGGYEYTTPSILNNVVATVQPPGGNLGWAITTGVAGSIVRNNIGYDTSGAVLLTSAGALSSKDHNLWFKSGTTPIVVDDGGTTYTTATIASFDATSLAVDPVFVSATAPYVPTNFSLQGSSPAIGSGVSLSSSFTNDYANATRGTVWDMGAFKVTP